MGFTALERVLEVVRTRPKASVTGFGVPLMHEHALPGSPAPFLVTGATGKMLRVPRTHEGMVRCGLYPCPVAQEDTLLARLVDSLTSVGLPRCTSVQDASIQARSILVSTALVGDAGADPQKATDIMNLYGNVGSLQGVQVVLTSVNMPPLLIGTNAGVYVRSGDHVGVILSLRSFMWVGE